MTAPTLPADPRQRLADSPLHPRQIIAIALCTLLNALDGYDILSISFAAPGIAREWQVSHGALGFVLSMELIGMAVGSLLLGQLADRRGRRPTALLCLAAMALGMAATTQVTSLSALAVTRLVTGLGIGGMLAATNALVAEYANARWRNTAVAVMAAGYPLGAALGGAVASLLLAGGNWRTVFALGAGVAAVLLPLVLWRLPEPPGALLARRPARALERVNASLVALGHAPVDALPPQEEAAPAPSLAELFTPALRATTLVLVLAYFLHMTTFYFLLKWVPKLVVDMGFTPGEAGRVLVCSSLGGLAGAAVFSALSAGLPVRQLLLGALMIAGVAVAEFGQTPAHLPLLQLASAIAGFATNGAVVVFYARLASAFPTRLRASGTGLVIGVGRGGAAWGPILAGWLFDARLGLPLVAAVMACGSWLAAALLAFTRRRTV